MYRCSQRNVNVVNSDGIVQPLGTAGGCVDDSRCANRHKGFILHLSDVLFCCFVSSLMFFSMGFVNNLLLKWYNSERSFLYSFLGRV